MLRGEFVTKAKAGSNRAAVEVYVRSDFLIVLTMLAVAATAFAQAPTSPASGAGAAAAPPAISTYSSSSTQSSSPSVSLPSGNQNPFLGSVPAGKATTEVIPIS